MTPIESVTDMLMERALLLNALGPGARLSIRVRFEGQEYDVHGETLDDPLRSLIRAEISKIDVETSRLGVPAPAQLTGEPTSAGAGDLEHDKDIGA